MPVNKVNPSNNVTQLATLPEEAAAPVQNSSSNLQYPGTTMPEESPNVLPRYTPEPTRSTTSADQNKHIVRTSPINVESQCSTTKRDDQIKLDPLPISPVINLENNTLPLGQHANNNLVNLIIRHTTIWMWPILASANWFVNNAYDLKLMYIVWVMFIILELFSAAIQKYYLKISGNLLLCRVIVNTILLLLLYFCVCDKMLESYWFKWFVMYHATNNGLMVAYSRFKCIYKICPLMYFLSLVSVCVLIGICNQPQ